MSRRVSVCSLVQVGVELAGYFFRLHLHWSAVVTRGRAKKHVSGEGAGGTERAQLDTEQRAAHQSKLSSAL